MSDNVMVALVGCICYAACGTVYAVTDWTSEPSWQLTKSPWWYYAMSFFLWPIGVGGDVSERLRK